MVLLLGGGAPPRWSGSILQPDHRGAPPRLISVAACWTSKEFVSLGFFKKVIAMYINYLNSPLGWLYAKVLWAEIL